MTIRSGYLRCAQWLIGLIVLAFTSPSHAKTPVVAAEVLKAYAANNSGAGPIVAWWGEGYSGGVRGHQNIYLFEDRRLFVSDLNKTPGRHRYTELTEAEFVAFLQTVRSHKSLWEMRPKHVLTRQVHQPATTLSIHIPDIKPLDVFVYGRLPPLGDSTASRRQLRRLRQFEDHSPRVAKLRRGRRPNVVDSRLHALRRLGKFHTVLNSMVPTDRLQLWDPGYVVISWADFAHARNQGRPWPAEWPSFESPLVRKLEGYVTERVMLFPSSHVREFEAFCTDQRGYVSTPINGRLMSPSLYGYPLPNKAKWIAHGTEALLQSQAAEAKKK